MSKSYHEDRRLLRGAVVDQHLRFSGPPGRATTPPSGTGAGTDEATIEEVRA
jgi:hypothetical protein